MYADKETDAMRKAIAETDRRRAIQRRYNESTGSRRRRSSRASRTSRSS
jgi:excinuclease UvrABC helicase subunit UvrB